MDDETGDCEDERSRQTDTKAEEQKSRRSCVGNEVSVTGKQEEEGEKVIREQEQRSEWVTGEQGKESGRVIG